MCRLLGLIANKEVDLRFSLLGGPKTLRTLSQHNHDGWGIGYYKGGNPVVDKEPAPAHSSKEYRRAAAEGQSRIFIAHVRSATTGARTEANTHPFQHKGWLFAHNGSVDREYLLAQLDDQHRRAVQGETDSEVLFHWLLQNIEGRGSVGEGVKAAVNAIRDYSSLNFLLSDGSTLHAFRQARSNPSYYTLFYLIRTPSDPRPEELSSSDVAVLLQSKALRGERAVLVCSERLTDESWVDIPAGSLVSVGSDLVPHVAKIAQL
jgi:glutamine amidotransferase